MAVLIEAICVIVRRAALQSRFDGGEPAFLRTIPNNAACHDDELFRVGFMDSTDADAYVGSLEAGGLIVRPGDETSDVAFVVQQQGPTFASPWLEYREFEFDEMKLGLCWAIGTTPAKFSAPPGWSYERSLSATGPGFLPASAIGDRLKFLRRENDVEVYLDLQTNQQVYAGRSQIAGDTPAALHTQVGAAMREALAIGERGAVPRPRLWRSKDPRYTRLNDELLPAMTRIAGGPGREMMIAHFAVGVILHLLGRLPGAEKALRRAHELRPDVIAPLRDLVRCIAEQRRPHDALPFARAAADLDPTDTAALGNLALCLMQCGQTAEGSAVIDRALEIDSADAINQRIRRALRTRRI